MELTNSPQGNVRHEMTPEGRERLERDAVLRAAQLAEFDKLAFPLVQDLRASGYPVDNIDQLVRFKPHVSALPILLDHLRRDYPDNLRHAIARAMAGKDAKPYWSALRDLYVAEPPDTGTKSGLAQALNVTVTRAHLDEYIELLRDRRNGRSRILLVQPLKRLRDDRGLAALEELSTDPELATQIDRTRRGIPPSAP